jgi:SAM-dependent methyltransferase
MNSLQTDSLLPSYFDNLYRANPDPWQFETSDYEAAKYAATIAALPRSDYRSALEIGGSIGVLTEKLADLCKALLSIDVSVLAQEQAIQRCQAQAHVDFKIMRVPEEFPDQLFDLILISEVGYYWNWQDLCKSRQGLVDRLEVGGHLLLVHWTPYAKDYPLSGDAVHDAFLELSPTPLRHLAGKRETEYRLDLFERR